MAAGLLALGACFGGSSSSSSGDGSGGDGGSAGGGGSAGQTGSGDPATCARIASRLRECDIVSAGTVACTARDDPTTRCRLGCLLAARCGTLSALFCEGTDAPEDLADIDPDAARCVEDCEPEPFRCDDGEVIDGDWRCDFERDCVDGSDEAGCRYDNAFTCDDGSAIDNFFQCDGIPDCADRSDELDCVGFECGNGQQIPRSYECDFEPDCLDGSDEHAGCAQLSCR